MKLTAWSPGKFGQFCPNCSEHCSWPELGETPELGQLTGPCNKSVPSGIKNAVRRWLAKQKKEHGIGRMTEVKHVFGPDEDLPF